MFEEITYIKELAKDKCLLIVEDDETVINSLRAVLKHFFTTIYTAMSVDDAIELYKQHYTKNTFLLITDINLGPQSGLDLSFQIKEINQDQRIIAISALEDSRVFMEAIERGIDSFLLKPVEKNKLFKTLATILQKINYDKELKNNRQLLEDSQKYTVQLLEEQDKFLKNAIHEIHTPLAIIIANIDLLRMQGIENESLDAIEAGSRTIENSYEDMTYLMKHHRSTSQKTTINLVEFIEERRFYFECIAVANELNLSLVVEHSNISSLYFSQLKLSRLVDNTISNAIKYSNKPSDITIRVGMRDEELFFEVHNYGVVIADTTKIFERFYRESLNKGGYGLGLNIVSQICAEENVKVEISSSHENGTFFCYTFKTTTQAQHNYSKMSQPID